MLSGGTSATGLFPCPGTKRGEAMWIKAVKVENYKSFDASDWVVLGPRFNFVIGKNNSGKTALLEAFKMELAANMPHRDMSIRRDAPSPPHSLLSFEIHLDPTDVFDAMQSRGGTLFLPISKAGGLTANIVAEKVLRLEGADILMQYRLGSGSAAMQYPSHQLFDDPHANSGRQFVSVSPTSDRRDFSLGGVSGGDHDNLPEIFAGSFLRRKIFVFEAERIRNSQVPFSSSGDIASDASNLPRALFEMERRPVLWETFNRHVNEILPNVRRVVTVGVGPNIQIQLWPIDPSSDRDDLVIKLSDSGAGVGQILSVLCAVLTYKSAVICIDEPNNFLHPGAVKALMRVLSQYDHQYVIATHSLEAVAAVNSDTVHIVEWVDGRSAVSPVNTSNLIDNRRVLSDLGVSISDVFGVDRILWVEGQTEEICFPMIIQDAVGYHPASLAVLRVRSVDEVLRRQGRENIVREVYQRLTQAGGLIPRATKFIFDREGRSQQYMETVESETSGGIVFIPRRTYENFLLDSDALADELSDERGRLALDPVSAEVVRSWLEANRARFLPRALARSPDWSEHIDAPKLLAALFDEVGQLEFRKTHHSPSLTRRLLTKRDKQIGILADFVKQQAGF